MKITINKKITSALIYWIPLKDLQINRKFWNKIREILHKGKKKYAKITIEIH